MKNVSKAEDVARLAWRQDRFRGVWRNLWVASKPGEGHPNSDWGYTPKKEQAILLSGYWQARFKADMLCVGGEARFEER